MFIQQAFIVGAGGAIGAMARFALYKILPLDEDFFNTLFINIIGCFCIGLVLGYTAVYPDVRPGLKLFIATGICGGFTTFSAFSAENMQLISQGKYSMAILYIIASIIGGLFATVLGFKLI